MARILLIDDRERHSPYFVQMLRKEGRYEVDVALSEEEYYAAISGKYDAALFPNLNSTLAILEDVREKGLPVLVLAREPAEIEDRARKLGARVLRKPLEFSIILKNLRELVPEKIKTAKEEK